MVIHPLFLDWLAPLTQGSFPCPIAHHATKTPQHPALLLDNQYLTYQDLNTLVDTKTHQLKDTGVQENSKVAFIATSTLETITLFFALFRTKAIACPISYRFPQHQIPSQLETLSATHFFNSSLTCLSTLQSPSSHLPIDPLATFLLTSGSSGKPKVVCHTLKNHIYSAIGAIPSLQVTSQSKWLLSLPLFHVSGIAILFRMFLSQGAVVLSHRPLFEALISHQITHVSLVPTQLYRLIQENGSQLKQLLPTLRCLLLGGAPLPTPLFQEALSLDLPLFTSFGMTETSSLATLATPEDLKLSPHVGKPLPFREITIDPDGQIYVKGEVLFKGYWNTQKKEVEPCNQNSDQDGFATKDIGTFDTQGNLQIIGRKDRQFISGGENIQPEEIEAALLTLPGILKATVIPFDDLEFGKRPVAFILDKTNRYTLDSIRIALQPLLPSFKHPVDLLSYPPNLLEQGIKPNIEELKHLVSFGK